MKLFLDCDGVLADFDSYATSYFGMPPREYEKQVGSDKFWKQLEDKGDFYLNLPLMDDAYELYHELKEFNPTILTGCPRGNWAKEQKIAWGKKYFPDMLVITCKSIDKSKFCKISDVLIDDWPKYRDMWTRKGGFFISHYDAKTSLDTFWAYYHTFLGH